MANLFIDEDFLNNMANAIIKQNKAHGTIDNYTISNEGLNPQQFADAIRHLDVAPLKQRPITKASLETNHIGKIEYKPVDADCWGSITVNVSNDERWREAINEPFSTVSDENLVRIVNALDSGLITPDQLNWKIGDERRIHLNSIENTTERYTMRVSVQDATLVIMDSGHYTLDNGKKDNFVIGFKNTLYNTSYIWCDDLSNQSWENLLWNNTELCRWLNTIFIQAIPLKLQSIFKYFFVHTKNTSTRSRFSLFAEKEIFGTYKYSDPLEAQDLTQIEYYKNSNNRLKQWELPEPDLEPSNINYTWLERSVKKDSNNAFCIVNKYGSASYQTPYAGEGFIEAHIAPFGCI